MLRLLARSRHRTHAMARSKKKVAKKNGIAQEPFWKRYLEMLRERVEKTPAHLLREEDLRSCLRDVLIEEGAKYYDIKYYLAEANDRVDIRLRSATTGVTYFIELKLWHATLKPRSGDGIRGASNDETGKHLSDLRKLLGRPLPDTRDCELYFISLTQSTKHPQAKPGGRLTKGHPGPFSEIPPCSANKQAKETLLKIMNFSKGEGWTSATVPAFKVKKMQPEFSFDFRVVEKRTWNSGGGSDWACKMDLHIWEVRPTLTR